MPLDNQQQPNAPEAKSDPLLGQVIDEKYRIDQLIGRGGMGVVYQATHVLIERPVALKMLHRHLIQETDEVQVLERFRREAKLQASIDHPNAVTVHDYGLYRGAPYLVMQLINGKSLKKLLQETSPLPLSRALPFILQVSEAIQVAHQRGIVHRDLKPDNIIIAEREDGVEKAIVTDFGIAKFLGSQKQDTNATMVGTLVGTPMYMSPEQARGVDIDIRSDIYSMGVILYEICTGKLPFVAEGTVGILMAHLETKPLPFKQRVTECTAPEAVENVVLKALEKSPSDRQQTLSQLIEELKTAAPKECGVQEIVQEERIEPAWPLSKIVIYALIAVLCLLLGLLVYQYSQYQQTQTENTKLKDAVSNVRTGVKQDDEAEKLAKQKLIFASLDDAVEKAVAVSELAVKAARLSQHIVTLDSASKREQFESTRDKTLEECRALIAAYLREVTTLASLTNKDNLEALIPTYMKTPSVGRKSLPNKLEVTRIIAEHLALVSVGNTPSEETIIAASVKAENPAALETYRGYFLSFCAMCEK